MLHRKLTNGVVLAALIAAVSCSSKTAVVVAEGNSRTPQHDLSSPRFTVEDAPEWTALFHRTSGWFGADGIFAIPCSGNDSQNDSDTAETVIFFSDTMIGEIEGGKLKSGYLMIHNSVATFKGIEPQDRNIQFYWDKKVNGEPESVFVPHTPQTMKGEYYWLGDGFVNEELNGNIYIFGYRVRDIPASNTFGFEQVGTSLIVLPKGSRPPFKDQRQIDAPLFLSGGSADNYTSYGSGILVNTAAAGASNPDGYVYVYGIRGKAKEVTVARVRPADFEQFDRWRYWDGTAWNADISKAASVADRASNELSVSPLPDGRYALIFQTDGISSTVGMRVGASPAGPFGPILTLWDCQEALLEKDFISYNAKAHPSLSKPGELLVSYNVNSFDFFNDIKVHPTLYRPRFFRVKF